MICLKVPEVGARFADGACAAAALESASTIATNIASLAYIAVPLGASAATGDCPGRARVALAERMRPRRRAKAEISIDTAARGPSGLPSQVQRRQYVRG